MNRVEIRGGLVRDPDLKFVGQTGVALLALTVAVNGTRYDSSSRSTVVKTTYVSVQAFGLLAERTMDAYPLATGDEVYVLGELDQSEYTDSDGKKERKTRVTALHIDVLRCRNYLHPTAGSSAAPTPPPSTEPPF